MQGIYFFIFFFRPIMPRHTLTHPDGPVVISEMTFRALASIRKLSLIHDLYGNTVISKSNYESIIHLLTNSAATSHPLALDENLLEERGFVASPALSWLYIAADRPHQMLPERIACPQHSNASQAATLRLAIAVPASVVLIDGPIKERAKLSFIKCEGTVSILVSAFRQGHLSAVKPMVTALEKLGHSHVLPPPDLLEALWTALADLTDEP